MPVRREDGGGIRFCAGARPCSRKLTGQGRKETMMEKMEKLQTRFESVKTITTAIDIARKATFQHKAFQHYTTLPALIGMIKGQAMWLTRGTSARLDDAQEGGKFGTLEQWEKTYIASFSYGESECAAMWGLYCKGKPDAIRLSIPQQTMRGWMEQLSKKCNSEDGRDRCVMVNPQKAKSNKYGRVTSIDFQDLVYAAVNGRGYDEVGRRNVLSWNGVISKPISTLGSEILASDTTGFVKDYEWAFEQESRLVVKMARKKGRGTKIAVPIPISVFKAMTITFGPWATRDQVDSFKRKLNKALSDVLPGECCLNDMCRRSVLHGALKNWASEK